LYVTENVTKFYQFSDGCTGQNDNHTLTRFLLILAFQEQFTVIQDYYPFRGHSFLVFQNGLWRGTTGCIFHNNMQRLLHGHTRILSWK
jgi:hypothetical protein